MNKLKKKIIQNYAKLTKKRIEITKGGIDYMFLSNGNIIEGLKGYNDNIRGHRARFVKICDEHDYGIDKLIESWYNEEEEEIICKE